MNHSLPAAYFARGAVLVVICGGGAGVGCGVKSCLIPHFVIPAKAGIPLGDGEGKSGIPAFAGMTS